LNVRGAEHLSRAPCEHLLKMGQGWSKLPSDDIAKTDRLVRRALECNPAEPLATAISGHVDARLRHDLVDRL
jgi:hypothetical protein